jgi:molybdopterin molybdotransferase
MRPFASTISFEDALAMLRAAAMPIDRTERLALDAASGRVLAAEVRAPRDVPAFDRSAMDGYAVRARDTERASAAHPVALRLLGRVYAGETADIEVDTGTCVEVATGAPIPAGADAVVMVEDTRAPAGAGAAAAPPAAGARAAAAAMSGTSGSGAIGVGNDVQVFAATRERQHIVRRAADMREGDLLLSPGVPLTASRLGALAAMGIGDVDVYAQPVVAILPTGDELTPLGTPLPAGHVYDVNRYTLAAVIGQHGGVPRVFPTVADNVPSVRAAIDEVSALANAGTGAGGAAGDARTIDLLVLTGGSSVGEHDLVIDVLRERGEVLFHGIAVKPGKPTALARIGRLLVLGMPGNPTSCLSNAHVLLAPLVRATGRLPAYQPRRVQATLAITVESPSDRYQFMPVRIEDGYARPTFKGSGEITSLSQADGYFEIPTHITRLVAGTVVDVTLY